MPGPALFGAYSPQAVESAGVIKLEIYVDILLTSEIIWAWLCAEAGSARRSALEAEDVDQGEPAWRAPESFVPDARQVFFLLPDLGLA